MIPFQGEVRNAEMVTRGVRLKKKVSMQLRNRLHRNCYMVHSMHRRSGRIFCGRLKVFRVLPRPSGSCRIMLLLVSDSLEWNFLE